MTTDRSTDRVESARPPSAAVSSDRPNKAADSSRHNVRPLPRRRLSRAGLRALLPELSARDLQVLTTLARVRVLGGAQLERLLFADIIQSARGRTRRRVLGRLAHLGLVVTLDRRIGGIRAGSAGLVYALSGAGQRLLDEQAEAQAGRRRTPTTPGQLFLAHALAISEVYVHLMETSRHVPGLQLTAFDVEADARWPEVGHGDDLRPDALIVLSRDDIADVWWLEVDRGSESLPRLERLLRRYLRFAQAGVAGPHGVIPRVLVSVTTPRRRDQLTELAQRLPAPADDLFVVCLEHETADRLIAGLMEGRPREPP